MISKGNKRLLNLKSDTKILFLATALKVYIFYVKLILKEKYSVLLGTYIICSDDGHSIT